MLKSQQLRELIIRPALQDMVMWSEQAEELLIFTCAVESDGGSYLKQVKGPALGIYQMEPKTYNDIWQNYIMYKPNLGMILGHNFDAFRMPSEDRLIYDLRFATAMARLHYYRVSAMLPAHDDIQDIWDYYRSHYNTSAGKADKDRCLQSYQSFIS